MLFRQIQDDVAAFDKATPTFNLLRPIYLSEGAWHVILCIFKVAVVRFLKPRPFCLPLHPSNQEGGVAHNFWWIQDGLFKASSPIYFMQPFNLWKWAWHANFSDSIWWLCVDKCHAPFHELSLQIIQFNFVSRFVPDKEFSGTDRSAAPRSGPVQFEKDEEDPFGLDQFLTQAKKAAASKRPKDDREGGSRKDERSRDDRGDKRRRKD